MTTKHPEPEPAKSTQHPLSPTPHPAEDPNRVITTQEDQIRRSEEMEQMGMEAWKEKHDNRTQEQRQPRTTPGLSPHKDEPGNTRNR